MKTLKQYLQRAQKERFAIGHFNFSDWSQVKGIAAAAQALKAPIILATSEGETKFVGLQEAVAMRNVLRKKTGLPIFLNLDHGHSFEYVKQAIDAGYDMVHFDGSKLPLEENIAISRQVAKYARWRGVVVEGEIGKISTDASKVYTEKFQIKEEDLTLPEEAKMYAKKTGVDILAVSVGTFHGVDGEGQSPNIRLDRLEAIKNAVSIPLVLHGGSGTPEQDLTRAVGLGIVKININTDIRAAFAESLKTELDKGEITPYKYLLEPINAVQVVVEEKIRLFGGVGKA